MHVKFQKTSETSKSFENNILSRAIQSAFEIKSRAIFQHGGCSHVLGDKKVHAYHVPWRKKQAQYKRDYLKDLKL